MNARVKRPFFFLAALLAAAPAGFAGAVENGAAPATVRLENEYWRVEIEPGQGARASAMHSLAHGRDFVVRWQPVTRGHLEGTTEGGAFFGAMSGSYRSRQSVDPWRVASRSAREAVFEYDNVYPLLDGLREERTVRLEGADLVCSTRVVNGAGDRRIIYYRARDMIGTGLNRGLDSVYVVPWTAGGPHAWALGPGEGMHRPFISPAGRWFALADLPGDAGLAVRVAGTDAASFYFWASRSDPLHKTAEIFFPRRELAPGESWSFELRYTAFAPSAPADTLDTGLATLLDAGNISALLARDRDTVFRAGLPYASTMELPAAGARASLVPAHLLDPVLRGGPAGEPGRTLRRVHLSGTPGEAVPLVFGVHARERIEGGRVAFDDLSGARRRRLPAAAIESRYVSATGGLLVKSWSLARDIPFESIFTANNDVVDAARLTPFTLEPGGIAWLYNLLRIPADAAPGDYRGRVRVFLDGTVEEVAVHLAVRPFRLHRPPDKTYGTFFRYYLRDAAGGGAPERFMPAALSREAWLEALRGVADAGYRGLVLYPSDRDDLLWIMERCRELGMDGTFLLLYPQRLRDGDIADLEEHHLRILGWLVDEPAWYHQLETVLDRYRRSLGPGRPAPAFTPNVPLGLLLSDHLPEAVPIIALSGNFAYGLEATRRYRAEGRPVFWYRTGQAEPSVEQRLIRGVYLWKEPVNGVFDWGDDTTPYRGARAHHLAGFAGTEVLPRLGRENIRQALIDLAYLHTLEALAAGSRDRALGREAEGLLDRVRELFTDDWYLSAGPLENPQFLDELRQQVADMAEKLVRAGRAGNFSGR